MYIGVQTKTVSNAGEPSVVGDSRTDGNIAEVEILRG